jgi:hypothetical protein
MPNSVLLMWVALPAGIDKTTVPPRARIAVLLVPRLAADNPATLDDPAYTPLIDWPQQLAQISFEVRVLADTHPLAATITTPPADLAAWRAVFPAATPVEPYVPDPGQHAARAISTYGHASLSDEFKRGYPGVYRSSPVVPPRFPEIRNAFAALSAFHEAVTRTETTAPLVLPAADGPAEEQIAGLHQAHLALARSFPGRLAAGDHAGALADARHIAGRLAALRPTEYVPLLPDTGSPADDLSQLVAFHTPAPPTPQQPFRPDFHAILTAMREYPTLLRRLGLLVDAEVPLSAIPASALGAQQPGALRVLARLPAALAVGTYSPWTAYARVEDSVFAIAASPAAAPETVAGLVNLAQGQYHLSQIDVDGAGLGGAAAMLGSQPRATGDGGMSGPPPLRTTGITLTRDAHAQQVKDRIAAALQDQGGATGAAPPPLVTLFAEDLLHGYRVDVRDGSGTWKSLHRRHGSITMPGLTVPCTDEGACQPSATQDPDGTDGVLGSMRIPETLARWEGWSLSVPRPGQAVADSGVPVPIVSQPQPGSVPLTASFQAEPGSLPRLRYGGTYSLRARAVDVAGGGLSVPEADVMLQYLGKIPEPISPLLPGGTGFVFQRFEPVPGAALVARERVTEGESVERLVIRSDVDETAAACASRLTQAVSSAHPKAPVLYLGTAERHVVPPKTAQQTVERTGLLDHLTPEAAYYLCCKECGRLSDDQVIDIRDGSSHPLPDVPGIDPVTGKTITRPAVELVGSGDTSYAVHHEEELVLPYLPDPLAAGAALCAVPGISPGCQAQPGPDGTLVIARSSLDQQTLDAITSVTWIPYSGSWPELEPFRLRLAEGSQPPSWDAAHRILTLMVPKGRTATIRLSSYLTDGALDLLGLWQWLHADGQQAGSPSPAADPAIAQHGLAWMLTPFRDITLVHAVQRPLLPPDLQSLTAGRAGTDSSGENATAVSLSGTLSVDGPSTAKVDVLATWTEVIDRPEEDTWRTAPGQAHVAELPVAAEASTVAFDGVRHEFGDTKYRHVTYQGVATSRFREYFPAEAGGLSSASTVTMTRDILSSARPPAPVVREVVPVVRWDRPPGGGPHRRHSAGVRVLLDRPWFVTGEGEYLGVVVADAAQGSAYPPSASLLPCISHWGDDPAWSNEHVTGTLTPDDFPAAGGWQTSWLPEAGSVAVVLHEVTFDKERGLWACDIPITAYQVYRPFVRLALARYQPNSLSGLALSRVVATPYAQLLPDRTVTVAQGTPADTVSFRVDGWTYHATGLPPYPPETTAVEPPLIDVTVEQRLPGGVDEAGWRPAPADLPITITCDAISGTGYGQNPPPVPLWNGNITLPPGRSPGQYRIVIREYELVMSDALEAYTWVEWDPDAPAPHKVVHHDTFAPGSRRLVFADIIDV